jgi:hypothetical protein
MKKSRFTGSQIIAVLKQAEAARTCRSCAANTASAQPRSANVLCDANEVVGREIYRRRLIAPSTEGPYPSRPPQSHG